MAMFLEFLDVLLSDVDAILQRSHSSECHSLVLITAFTRPVFVLILQSRPDMLTSRLRSLRVNGDLPVKDLQGWLDPVLLATLHFGLLSLTGSSTLVNLALMTLRSQVFVRFAKLNCFRSFLEQTLVLRHGTRHEITKCFLLLFTDECFSFMPFFPLCLRVSLTVLKRCLLSFL